MDHVEKARQLAAELAAMNSNYPTSIADTLHALADAIERMRQVIVAADRLAFRCEENPAYREDAFALQDMITALAAEEDDK